MKKITILASALMLTTALAFAFQTKPAAQEQKPAAEKCEKACCKNKEGEKKECSKDEKDAKGCCEKGDKGKKGKKGSKA